MNKAQKDFQRLLSRKVNEDIPLPRFTKKISRKLLNRIKHIQLYAHSYAFFLHFEHTDYNVTDFLNFAHQNGLSGIDISIDDGKVKPLKSMNLSELQEVKEQAKKLNLKIVLEISSTIKSEIQKVVKIAKILDVQYIRVYNNYSGYLSDCIQKCIKDLKYACELAEKYQLYFSIESHEVIKSDELIRIVSEVGSPRLGVLFDFGNMINANEKPLEALKTMSPYIWHTHIKDVRVISEKHGYGHQGVTDGRGDLPQLRMLYDLLMLGDKNPQVKIFSLEQVNGYYALPYRFKGEGKNPKIPKRKPSYTREDRKLSRDQNLLIEKENAIHQIKYIKRLLNQLLR